LIADTSNGCIREVNASTGVITTVAGDGTNGFSGDGGPATDAEMYGPIAVALDSSGNLFVADGSNQRIREVTSPTSVTLTVTPSALTVTADDACKTYGDADPAFSASYSGLVNGDDASALGGALAFATNEGNPTSASPGTYEITPSGLTSSNYTITFANGLLTVDPPTIQITGDTGSGNTLSHQPAVPGSVSGTWGTNSCTEAGSASASNIGAGWVHFSGAGGSGSGMLGGANGTVTYSYLANGSTVAGSVSVTTNSDGSWGVDVEPSLWDGIIGDVSSVSITAISSTACSGTLSDDANGNITLVATAGSTYSAFAFGAINYSTGVWSIPSNPSAGVSWSCEYYAV
jgi:hypothetical protein